MRPYGELTKQILLGVGIAGVIIVVAAAPGIVLAAKLFDQNQKQFPKKYSKHTAAQTIRRLKKNNLITVKKKGGEFLFELTREGKRVFQEIQQKERQLAKLRIVKPAQWDGTWRLLLFDIPDKSHKRARDILRQKLKEWEFYPLQKSVWACPWPCEKEIQLAIELYGVSSYAHIVTAKGISDDGLLRKHFQLS